MFFYLKCTLSVVLVVSSAATTLGECGRVFQNIPGPFSFGKYYVDETGTRWSAGGGGTLSIQPADSEAKVIKLSTEADFHSVFVVNRQFGFAVGDLENSVSRQGSIFATGDGGQTWLEQKPNVKAELRAVNCLDYLNCWVVGEGGTILRSSNGGVKWNLSKVKQKETLLAVDFVNDRVGWTVGSNGLVLKTIDGGVTWNEEKTLLGSEKSTFSAWRGIVFRDDNMGCIAGYNRIACTSDGGNSWNRTIFDDAKVMYNFINFVFYADRIRILEECGEDFVSTDSGKTWKRVKKGKSFLSNL